MVDLNKILNEGFNYSGPSAFVQGPVGPSISPENIPVMQMPTQSTQPQGIQLNKDIDYEGFLNKLNPDLRKSLTNPSVSTNTQVSGSGKNTKDVSNRDKDSWAGVITNLPARAVDIGTGLAFMLGHPIEEVGKPLGNYFGNKYWEVNQGDKSLGQALGEVAKDTGSMFVTHPVLGQSIDEMTQDPSNIGNRFARHLKEGGLLDIGLTYGALPKTIKAPVNRAVGGVVSKGARTLDDVLLKGKGQEIVKTSQAKKGIESSIIYDKIESIKDKQKLKKDLQDLYKTYNIKEADLEEIIKKAEKVEGKTLADLTPEEQVVYNNLKPILDDYNLMAQKYTTGTPDLVTEIVQAGVRDEQGKGNNVAYSQVNDLYKQQGLWDYGHFINKKTGEAITQPIYKAEQNPSTRVSQLGETNTFPSLSQIYRRNGMTDKYNFDSAIKKVNNKYKNINVNSPEAIDYALDIAEVKYKKLIDDVIKGDREVLNNAEAPMQEILTDLPNEYQGMFRERFANDIEDIKGSKYSSSPISDIGDPANVNRYSSFRKKLSNIRKYSDLDYSKPLGSLSNKAKNLVREHLTPEEFTDFLESGSTLRDVSKYIREVSEEAIKERQKPYLGKDPVTNEVKEFDLRNTRFEIPEENLDALAARAMDDPIAERFLTDYVLAKEGKLQRIPHGLAEIDKEGITGQLVKGRKNKENLLFSERTYGTASPRDIAGQLIDPDAFLGGAIRGFMRERMIDKFFEDYKNTGKPIMSKGATPEDIRYISREMFNNSKAFKNIDSSQGILKELPEGVNPADYVAIDKYSLRAFKDLFYPGKKIFEYPKIVKDLTSLMKQAMLQSGIYLGGNVAGTLHSLITNANVGMFDDISSAIKTRGGLIKQLGLQREMPNIINSHTVFKGQTPVGRTVEKAIRGAKVANSYTGAQLMNMADAAIQNSFAEAHAHTIFRKLGVPFENRNLQWMKENLSKEQVYQALNDIQKAGLIYGDLTGLPKSFVDFMEPFAPFSRWVVQAMQSSHYLLKNNPALFGYLQGAVLGGYAWDKNVANANGLDIDNPQSGKIYKFDPKTGNTKVTETEMIPVLTGAKLIANPWDRTSKIGTTALATNLLEPLSTKDRYGRIKERGVTPNNIQYDFRKNVRYKDGVVQDNAELDEALAGYAKQLGVVNFLNKVALPIEAKITGQEVYQPYSEQVFVQEEGNPRKPVDAGELPSKLKTEYTRNLVQGVDVPLTDIEQMKLQKSNTVRRLKQQRAAEELAKKKKGGNQ